MRRFSGAATAIAGMTLGVAIAMPSALVAQAPPAEPRINPRSISFNVSGVCNLDQLAKLEGLALDRLVKGLGFTYVLKAPNVRTTVNTTSDALTTQPQLFDSVVLYARDSQSKSLLISYADRKYCGWVEPGALLYDPEQLPRFYQDGPKPVQVQNGPDGENNTGNDLFLKVVLQNLKRDGQDGAPILTAPGQPTSAPGLRKLKLFYVFEVFRWQKAASPEHPGQERIYYLVGRSGDKASGGKLEGWVHEDDLYVWTSRVAAFWAGTGEARGYFSRELLGGDQFAIKEPEKGKLREPSDKTVQRFPVISQEPSTAEIVKLRREANARDIDGLIKNYRIATPSCARQAGAPGQVAEECVSGTDEVEARKAKLKNIDIMFVMDATKSMEPYHPAARKALEQFIEHLRQQQTSTDVNVRIAVHVYGDYKTNEPDTRSIDYVKILPFLKLDDAKTEFGRLEGLKMFDDFHRDRPEASFAAIMKGAGSTDWSPNAGIRYLVHIGDHGNREYGKTSGTGTSTLVERFREEDVAGELKPKGIVYVGIPVLGTFDKPHNAAYIRQAKRIGELLPKLAAPVRPTYDIENPRPSESDADRVAAMLRVLKEGVEISQGGRDRVAGEIECAQNAQSALCRRSTDQASGKSGWMAEVIEGLQERNGLTRDEINRVYGRSQTVGTFYFKPLVTGGASNGQRQFKYYIAIEDVPLKRLSRISIELCDNIDKSDGARYLRRVIDETLQTVMDSQYSVADVMASRLFIPAFHFNELLLKPWNEMEDAIRHLQGTAGIDTYKQNFCKSAKLLQWALEGKKLADGEGRMVWDAREKVWRQADDRALRDYNWRHDGGTSIPLYYIPIEFLPN